VIISRSNSLQAKPSTAFRLISDYCRKAPPIGVGTFSSREAVLPLVCCVKEDGLQMDRLSKTGGSAHLSLMLHVCVAVNQHTHFLGRAIQGGSSDWRAMLRTFAQEQE
jgi:hypothetical protein